VQIVTINPNKCVGCLNCLYECSFTQGGDFKTQNSNIRVNFYSEESVCIPFTCVHCSKAWCMEICPANAISRNKETGAVEIDQSQCAGCKMCMMACPMGNIHFNATTRVSNKCDLCGGDPSCVKHCISGALQFEDETKAFDYKRKNIDHQMIQTLKER
jgi:anaerobic carbon-monoxide dehydrogenase iron sulfur subunit